MSTHYNAFISYKHAELDNKIAATIERSLEHYHIPRKIQKKTGVKRIERIFRDTDELPITSDLSGTIAEALENADYLIVICSTNTCKSMWVEREIKLFLQNHTQDQILTVLADGEPVDVVPEILKNKQVTRVNEQGIEETETIPVEPLSCDFRLPAREAKNIELPRLAAALIGCEYNELMDRQRQYKMKRLTAVFAAVMAVTLAFAGYMIYSNKKVNDSYRASLISQSKYLANESGKLLNDEQRMDALHLALAALPSEEMPDRPVTVEAVRAITKATGAYMPLYSSNLASRWTYELPNSVQDIRVNSNNNFIAAIDVSGNIKVWDAQSHEELYSYSEKGIDNSANYIGTLEDGSLLIKGTHFFTSINPRTGEENWKVSSPDYNFGYKSAVILTKEGDLITNTRSSGHISFKVFSSKDGSVIETYDLSQEIDDLIPVDIDDFVVSPDKTKIAFSYTKDNLKKSLVIHDIPSGKDMAWSEEYAVIPSFAFSNDNDLYISCSLNDNSKESYKYMNMKVLSPAHHIFKCMSSEDFSEKWSHELDYYNINLQSRVYYIKDNNTLLAYVGEVAVLLDASSGEVLKDYRLNTPIVAGFLNSNNWSPFFLTNDGYIAQPTDNPSYDPNTVTALKYFVGNISMATNGKTGYYICENASNRIIYYGFSTYDEDWKAFKDAPKFELTPKSYLDDNALAQIIKEEDSVYINIYDPNEKSTVEKIKLGGPDYTDRAFTIHGTFEGKLLLTYEDSATKDFMLCMVDYKTGEQSSRILNKGSFVNEDAVDYQNGKLAYTRKESTNTFVVIYDIAKDKEQRYLVDSDSSMATVNDIYYFEKQGFIYYSGKNTISFDHTSEDDAEFVIDLKENEVYPIEHNSTWYYTKHAAINDAGTMIATVDDSYISIKDPKGNDVASIPLNSASIAGFIFYKAPGTGKDILIVPYDDGNLCRYDAATGELLYKTTYEVLGFSTLDKYDTQFTFDTVHSCIYMQQNAATTIFDLDTFIELGFVYDSIGYHAPTDTFIAVSQDEERVSHLGYFRHYTLDDLIKKAKDILKDHEMPQEQKDAYGIG